MAKGWESSFPNLKPEDWQETSPDTRAYNCFAWAAEDPSRRWEPDLAGQYYWPDGAPRRRSLTALVKAYETIGYQHSTHSKIEPGFQKIAIYVSDAGIPCHAARQIEDGRWTSKLGDFEDITHEELESLTSNTYGRPKKFLKRRLPQQS